MKSFNFFSGFGKPEEKVIPTFEKTDLMKQEGTPVIEGPIKYPLGGAPEPSNGVTLELTPEMEEKAPASLEVSESSQQGDASVQETAAKASLSAVEAKAQIPQTESGIIFTDDQREGEEKPKMTKEERDAKHRRSHDNQQRRRQERAAEKTASEDPKSAEAPEVNASEAKMETATHTESIEMEIPVAPETRVEEMPTSPQVSPRNERFELSSVVEPVAEQVPSAEAPTHLERLREEVAEVRRQFAEVELKDHKERKKMKNFFGLKSIQENQDVAILRESYQAKLIALKEQELQALKDKGLEGLELKQEMANLLRYFKYEEAISLYDAQTEARKEQSGLGGKLLEKYNDLGRWYNGLSRGKKIAVTIALAASTMGLAAAGGAVAATAGASAIAVRRLISGAGLSVTVDTALGAVQEKRAKKKNETEIEENLKFVDGIIEEDQYRALDMFLEDDISLLDEKIKDKRKKTLFRKAVSVAFGASSGYLLSQLFSSDAEKAETPAGKEFDPSGKEDALTNAQAMEAQLDPDAAAVLGTEASLEQVDSSGEAEASTETASAPEAAPEKVTGGIEEALREYAVTAADSEKGLWGILESRIPQEMAAADKNNVIRNLEIAIQNKLSASDMTPERLKALGFPSGDINSIHPGDTLKFDQLFSKEEYEAILNGEAVSPIVAAAEEAQPETADTAAAVDELLEKAPATDEAAEVLGSDPEQALPAPEVPADAEAETISENPSSEYIDTGLKDYFEAVPDDSPLEDPTAEALKTGEIPLEEYRTALADTRKTLFVTPETNNWPKYLNAALQKEPMGNIAQAAEALVADPSAEIHTNLHASQVDRIRQYIVLTRQDLGAEARFGRSETLEHWTRRVTTLDFQKNGSPVLADKFHKIIKV